MIPEEIVAAGAEASLASRGKALEGMRPEDMQAEHLHRLYVRAALEAALPLLQAEWRKGFEEIIAEVRGHYPEDVFPPIEKGQNAPPRPPDAFSAAGARIACDNILRLLRAALGDS